MVNWKEFFDEKVDDQNVVIKGSIQNPQKIFNSALILLLHIVGLVGAAIFVFKKKDVLS
jgi:ABC-2 type transport system permease protein